MVRWNRYWLLPNERIVVGIITSDLKIEISDPTPKGGQHVGVISTRVRVTHIQTGIAAECGFYRSQMKNRDVAIAMIEYGLAELNES